jgi:hypothetical protein
MTRPTTTGGRHILQTTLKPDLAEQVEKVVAERHCTISQYLRDLVVRDLRDREAD